MKERKLLFLDVVKWSFLATCIGVIVGLATSVFLKLLNAGVSFRNQYSLFFLLLPLAFLLSSLIV